LRQIKATKRTPASAISTDADGFWLFASEVARRFNLHADNLWHFRAKAYAFLPEGKIRAKQVDTASPPTRKARRRLWVYHEDDLKRLAAYRAGEPATPPDTMPGAASDNRRQAGRATRELENVANQTVHMVRIEEISPEAASQLRFRAEVATRETPVLVGTAKPKWDAETRTLHYGDQLVKKFRQPAANQETILSTFEDDGWPVRIDDPLTGNESGNPSQRRLDTIHALNEQKVKCLHFTSDGNEGILWSPVDAKPL
jgi:hypothetical protein